MSETNTVPWIVWPVLLPLVAATLVFLLGQRGVLWVTLLTGFGILLAVGGLTWQVWEHGPQPYAIGGWGALLGINLYADGLTALMLIMSALVGGITSVYALGYLNYRPSETGNRKLDLEHESGLFWPLWLFLWAALNALFLSADIFNLYVILELIGLSAVALVTLAGQRAALTAGMRYLLTSLLGSLVYLLGVALLYAAFSILDLRSLGTRIVPGPTVWSAIALMTVGLLLKTALFPLHFWLPPAHSNAPAPVSALLSGLVVKASFYLFLRLWFQVFTAALTPAVGQLLGGLGVAAILWGSLLALRQQRLKLLVAYSTVAQIGYLFLLFPLATRATWGIIAWSGGIYHILSHACAKAAMFMAVGIMLRVLGHDRINSLGGIGQQQPMAMFAFALAGVTLMGLPPSGGFVAKWLLLTAALQSGQWWWAGVIVVGGLLAAGYVFLVLRQAFVSQPLGVCFHPVPHSMELAALTLAMIALLLGLTAKYPLALLQIGAPFSGGMIPEVVQ